MLDIQPSEIEEIHVLWRYLTFPKFLHLLKTRSLYFSHTSKFEDPFEGHFGVKENEATFDFTHELDYRLDNGSETSEKRDAARNHPVSLREDAKALREASYVNCWSASTEESAAMWRLYCPDLQNGVAIKTSEQLLRQSFTDNASSITLRKVEYKDLTKDFAALRDLLFTKLVAFEHEREFRAVTVRHDLSVTTSGLLVPVNLSSLINTIVLNPFAEDWFFDTVVDLAKHYGVSAPIQKSIMSRTPF